MYNTQEIAKRIKNVIKTRNEPLGTMLSNLEMGVNTVSELGKGKQISYLNFAKIADYLNVSVDYLLGRTDEPSIKNSNIISINGNNSSNISNVNIGKASSEDISEITEMIKNLSLIERSKVVLFIEEMKGENK